ncbi:MAG: serine hydrolase [Rhodothermales bacterium]
MLQTQIAQIGREAGAETIAVALHDYDGETAWSLRGDRPFHAASTMKVAVLFALFDAFERGTLPASAVLHVRNRFLSAADGAPYRVATDRDANADVHAAIGRLMPVRELARHMITTSSNLATNLLVDLIGVEPIRTALAEHGVEGIDVVRGVEDETAWEAGLNNTVTANGLVALFRAIHEATISDDATEGMKEILFAQQFTSGIPNGLPDDAKVAHKTGEISTVTHDAGLVFLPDRAPYALAILTEWDPETAPSADARRATLADISRAVYDYVTAEEVPHD